MRERFAEIEGLRGFLALWVVFGHAWQFAPVRFDLPVVNRLISWTLAVPSNAVDAFIIVSGFVITHLILTKAEPYPVYITRRFFRLWPLLVICCLAGWATYQMHVDMLTWPSWAEKLAAMRESRLLRLDAIQRQPIAQWLAHVTMLHGLPPEALLPQAASTFLGPAWSLSLEWQFYLIAPLAIGGLRSVLLAVIACAAAAWGLDRLGVFGVHERGFLPQAVGYFGIGIGCRFATPHLRARNLPALPLAAAFLALAALSGDFRGLGPWAAFYAFLVGRPVKAFERVFTNPVAAFLGQISYSIYMAHYVVLIVVAWVVFRLFPAIGVGPMFGLLAGSAAVVILVASGLYRWVEKPGIVMGNRLAYSLPAAVSP